MNTNAWIQSEKERDMPFPAKNVLCDSFAKSHHQDLLHSLLHVSHNVDLPFLREEVETGDFGKQLFLWVISDELMYSAKIQLCIAYFLSVLYF